MTIVHEIPNQELVGYIKQLIEAGRRVTFCPKGNSMLPFIRGGEDSVILVAPGILRRGDILLVELQAGSYVLHRFIRKDGEKLVLMGDGNIHVAERCVEGQVIAKVATIIRDGRYIDCVWTRFRRSSRLWMKLSPIRRYLLGIYRRIYS